MLRNFLIRWAANGVGLWIAAELLNGVDYGGAVWVIVIAALVFSLVNMLIRPILILLSLPAIILTLGFFTLIVNSFMLYLVTVIYPRFTVESLSAAIVTVIIVWLVNYALNALLKKEK